MSSKGQITVPKAVREYFDLKAGDRVAFTLHEDGVLIQRYVGESPFAKWRGYLKDLKGEDVDRLIDEMRGR
jgi:AbrB family looped-hinge helix DNA binding protein